MSAGFAGALLVGNFGNGKINAFNPDTGDFLGMLTHPSGKALKIDAVWGLEARPDRDTITFAAGPNDQSDGLVGLIHPANP